MSPWPIEVADALDAPLDVFQVRKLGVPGQEELAMGAVASGGVRVLNQVVVEAAGVDDRAIEDVARAELAELERRERLYRNDRPTPVVAGPHHRARRRRAGDRIDDARRGHRTASAERCSHRRGCSRRIASNVRRVRGEADDVVCVKAPARFGAVGWWYDDFSPTEDDDVCALLRDAANRRGDAPENYSE